MAEEEQGKRNTLWQQANDSDVKFYKMAFRSPADAAFMEGDEFEHVETHERLQLVYKFYPKHQERRPDEAPKPSAAEKLYFRRKQDGNTGTAGGPQEMEKLMINDVMRDGHKENKYWKNWRLFRPSPPSDDGAVPQFQDLGTLEQVRAQWNQSLPVNPNPKERKRRSTTQGTLRSLAPKTLNPTNDQQDNNSMPAAPPFQDCQHLQNSGTAFSPAGHTGLGHPAANATQFPNTGFTPGGNIGTGQQQYEMPIHYTTPNYPVGDNVGLGISTADAYHPRATYNGGSGWHQQTHQALLPPHQQASFALQSQQFQAPGTMTQQSHSYEHYLQIPANQQADNQELDEQVQGQSQQQGQYPGGGHGGDFGTDDPRPEHH